MKSVCVLCGVSCPSTPDLTDTEGQSLCRDCHEATVIGLAPSSLSSNAAFSSESQVGFSEVIATLLIVFGCFISLGSLVKIVGDGGPTIAGNAFMLVFFGIPSAVGGICLFRKKSLRTPRTEHLEPPGEQRFEEEPPEAPSRNQDEGSLADLSEPEQPVSMRQERRTLDEEITSRELLNRTFGIATARIASMGAIALIVLSPSLLLELILELGQSMAIGSEPPKWSVVGGYINAPVQLVLTYVMHAVIVVATIEHMHGRPIRIWNAVNTVLRRFVPLVVAVFLFQVVRGLGFALLILPGLILWCMLLVAVPAVATERIGPFAGLRRSHQLTKGYLRTIFGALLLVLVVQGALELPFQHFQPNVVTVRGSGADFGANLLWLAMGWAKMIINNVLPSVLSGVFYVRVRNVREGRELKELVSIFQ